MNPSLLVVIDSDPRLSGRAAEAVRIAAGVGSWRKVDVTLYLRGAAVLALGEYVDGLVDEDNFTRYLPIVGGFGPRIRVQKGCPLLAELGEASLPFEEVSDAELASLAMRSRYVLRF